jgi:uroporphyrinogen-III synthase
MTAVESRPLAGWRVLVTRPAHQAENLCRLIEAQGGRAERLPLISVEPLAHAAPVARQLEQARDWDGWLFTSANAVRHAAQIFRGNWCPRLYAVGAATAAALEAGGRELTAAPRQAHSGEALLALPELQEIAGGRFLVVTGERGLDVLAPGLRARGAQADVAEVYRRVPMPYPEARVLAALRGVDAVIVTSGEALEHLMRLTPESSRPTLLKRLVVVPSERVVEKARGLGFVRVQAPALMADAQIAQLLVELSHKNVRTPDDD